MKILYYCWDEITAADCIDSMRRLSYEVHVFEAPLQDYDRDPRFMEQIGEVLKEKYDCIFSFNFYPILSRAAKLYGTKYVSWIFDSPLLTLESVTLDDPVNEVFIFDRMLYQKYAAQGIRTVHYLPLAYHSHRLSGNEDPVSWQHDITFLGTLYDDENNFFDQIRYMPEKLRGYIDGVMDAQKLVYGCDLVEPLFNREKCQKLADYVKIDMGPLYRDCRDDIFRDMIRKKLTVIERREYLYRLGNRFSVDLYAPKAPEDLPVRYMGYANYVQEMPGIFRSSKINLNITLRSILSGIPLRVIDILGAGGFVLTNYQAELPEYFINGEDLVWYESEGDMVEKAAFYLEHDTERQRIAENGHRKAEQIFTYEKLLPELFSMAGVVN